MAIDGLDGSAVLTSGSDGKGRLRFKGTDQRLPLAVSNALRNSADATGTVVGDEFHLKVRGVDEEVRVDNRDEFVDPGGVVNDRLIKAVNARVNKPEGVIIIVS